MVMAYIKKTVKAGKTMEIIKYHDRAHGKKGGPRQKRKNPTSLRQELANRRRAENRLRWLLNANFEDGDLSLTCTYVKRAGEEPMCPLTLIMTLNRGDWIGFFWHSSQRQNRLSVKARTRPEPRGPSPEGFRSRRLLRVRNVPKVKGAAVAERIEHILILSVLCATIQV
jgi:hypothetical protein